MSEETKNTAELTDKQLEKVAGGEGGETYSFEVLNLNGANIYRNQDSSSSPIGWYSFRTILFNCTQSGLWVCVPAQLGKRKGYVLRSDLR